MGSCDSQQTKARRVNDTIKDYLKARRIFKPYLFTCLTTPVKYCFTDSDMVGNYTRMFSQVKNGVTGSNRGDL